MFVGSHKLTKQPKRPAPRWLYWAVAAASAVVLVMVGLVWFYARASPAPSDRTAAGAPTVPATPTSTATTTVTLTSDPPPTPTSDNSLAGTGVYTVGPNEDAIPGEYKTDGPMDPLKACVFYRLDDGVGSPVLEHRETHTRATVLLRRSDDWFISWNCGPWVKTG